jgi:toxin secretion/phage lysis holin
MMDATNEAQNVISSLQFTQDLWVVFVPLILMAADIATGFINAWAKHNIKSAIMRQGLARKFGELVIIAIAQLFLYAVGLPKTIASGVSFYIAIMELISICENLDKLGVPIPKFVKKALHSAEEQITNEKKEENGKSKKKGGTKNDTK